MPAIAELIPPPAQGLTFGLFGKHPAFGDFLSRRLDPGLLARLERWLDQSLSQLRDGLAEGWGMVFDVARPLRFWLGADVTGCGPLAGVLVPSRDKVGRRYPLIILTPGPPVPPTQDADQSLHDQLATALSLLLAGDAADLPASGPPMAPAPTPDASVLWATNPATDAVALFADLAQVDHQRAAQTRSYWWAAPDATRSAAMFACAGFPDGAALSWLFCGVAREATLSQPDPQQDITRD